MRVYKDLSLFLWPSALHYLMPELMVCEKSSHTGSCSFSIAVSHWTQQVLICWYTEIMDYYLLSLFPIKYLLKFISSRRFVCSEFLFYKPPYRPILRTNQSPYCTKKSDFLSFRHFFIIIIIIITHEVDNAQYGCFQLSLGYFLWRTTTFHMCIK